MRRALREWTTARTPDPTKIGVGQAGPSPMAAERGTAAQLRRPSIPRPGSVTMPTPRPKIPRPKK